jgi:aryl sulfotransferase
MVTWQPMASVEARAPSRSSRSISTFDYMRKTASTNSPLLDVVFQGGASTFFHKGTNGRWRDVLSSAEVRRYEEMARANLTPECAQWVATGEMTR